LGVLLAFLVLLILVILLRGLAPTGYRSTRELAGMYLSAEE
jgi:hypothetical protein